MLEQNVDLNSPNEHLWNLKTLADLHTHTRKNLTRYQLTDSRHLEPITKLK